MDKGIKTKIDEKLDEYRSKKPLNRDFFYQFFDILQRNGYRGNYDKAMDLVFENLNEITEFDSKEPLRFMHGFPVCQKRAQALLDFFEDRLKHSADKNALIDEMFDFAKAQSSDETSFCNNFVKFLSLKYPDQITLDVQNADFADKEDDLIVFAKLGDFGIGALEASYINGVGATVHEIRTLKNLTSQRIGLMLMQKFFQIVDEKFPEQEDLIVQNVVNKNVGAQRFYERLGGLFYTPKGLPIKREEITADNPSEKFTNVIYDKTAMKKLAKSERVVPLNMHEFVSKTQKESEKITSK